MQRIFDGQQNPGSKSVLVGSEHAVKVLVVQVVGLVDDVVTPEVSINGTDWVELEGIDGPQSGSSSITKDGVYRYDVSGLRDGQVRVTKTGSADVIDVWAQQGTMLR